MPPLDQIRKSIEARLTELDNEIAALQAARTALFATGSPAATKRRAATSAKAATKSASGNGASQNDGAGPSPQARVKSAESPSKPRRPRRKTAQSEKRGEVLLAGKLEAMLAEAHQGLSAITISKRANAGYNQVRDLLRELEASGQVRRTGTRRTSLWRLITEEEQIAERAAELERLSLAQRGS